MSNGKSTFEKVFLEWFLTYGWIILLVVSVIGTGALVMFDPLETIDPFETMEEFSVSVVLECQRVEDNFSFTKNYSCNDLKELLKLGIDEVDQKYSVFIECHDYQKGTINKTFEAFGVRVYGFKDYYVNQCFMKEER